MLPWNGGNSAYRDSDVQAVLSHVGAEAGGRHHLPEVQVKALERAEAAFKIATGPPSVGALDSP
jgi:hypothetical protein